MYAIFDQRRNRWIRASDLRVTILGIVFKDCVMVFQSRERAEIAKERLPGRALEVFHMTATEGER